MNKWILTFLLPLGLLQVCVSAQSPVASPTTTPLATPAPTTLTQETGTNLTPFKKVEQLRWQLVNCGNFVDCGLARMILPASTLLDRHELRFDNPSAEIKEIDGMVAFADGEFTGYQLSHLKPDSQHNSPLSLPTDIPKLRANQTAIIPIGVDRSVIPPDRYTGEVQLKLKNSPERLTLVLNINSRSGPLVPVLVLLVGVILGRLLKYMQERGGPQSKALETVYQLQADIAKSMIAAGDKQLLAVMVAEVSTLVFREQLVEVPGQIQAIRDRLATLVKLQALEDQLNLQAYEFPTDVDVFTTKIRQVRQLIVSRDDEKAKKLLVEIDDALDKVKPAMDGTGKAALEASRGLLRQAVKANDVLNQPSPISLVQSRPVGMWQMVLANLAGISEQTRAEATFWVVRPLLSLVLLGGLLATGMNTLYVENGLTFGSKPLGDYLGLILWGLSADVASRSLSNLTGKADS